jgi:hypothetical protein
VVSHTLKKHLLKTHRAAAGSTERIAGPVGRVRYGRCRGGAYYALASFTQGALGTQDQPEAFKRTLGGLWRDRGDTGGDPTGKAPGPLLALWGYRSPSQ